MTSPYMCTCMQMHQTATSLLLARQSSRAMLLYMLVSMCACVRACVRCVCVCKNKSKIEGKDYKIKTKQQRENQTIRCNVHFHLPVHVCLVGYCRYDPFSIP